ncbi:MAG TPA: TonB-dependent receptor [Candidatus Obscuribacterales bacterium]
MSSKLAAICAFSFALLACAQHQAVAAPQLRRTVAAGGSPLSPDSVPAGASPLDSTAPSKTRTVEGIVKDADSGKPLPHVSVSLRRTGDTHAIEIQTDEKGAFAFRNVRPGDYVLTVSADGLLAQTRTISFKQELPTLQEFELEPIETADVLHVIEERTHPTQVGTTTHIDKKYLEQIGNGNDLRTAINTTPGMMPDSLGNVITRGEHNAVNYTLDGAVLPETAGVLQQSQIASPRSLQSLDVDVGGYEASDGGGPMGAIVHMKSMPVSNKPVLLVGTQLGAPIAGGGNYYFSSPVSLDPNRILNRLRVESSGSLMANKLGLQPGTRDFRRDAKLDINSMTKVTFDPTERDHFALTVAINESYMHQPTSPISRAAGVKINEHDRQNFIVLSYRHRFAKFFDEANLHVINSFYSQRIGQPNVFDPNPVINGNGFLRSAAVDAKRYNYVISAQGDISKTVFKTHQLKAGFLTDLKFVRTQLSEFVYNADPTSRAYGQIISPFTGAPGGPNFGGPMGKYHGSQWIQSVYLQDTWKPAAVCLKRFTLNYGCRFDLSDSLFGNAMGIAQTVATITGVGSFNVQPFQRQTQINAQLSGRYGGTYALTKTTMLRASFSNIFVPNPVDYFLTPFDVTAGPNPFNGIFNGSPRPLQAMRGRLVDAGVEQQIGRRFVMRNNVFYKKLYHFGDSGVIDNSIVYNRLTNNEQEAYGYETRLELKPSRNGTGFYGYLSNTLAVAYLRGSRLNDGEVWIQQYPTPTTKYPDHDRREAISAAFGYRRPSCWILATATVYSGVKDERDPAIYGPHPARVPGAYFIGLNAGVSIPPKWKHDHRWAPDSLEVRIQNLTNNRAAINLGSPYQGTRYALPIQVLACTNWKIL